MPNFINSLPKSFSMFIAIFLLFCSPLWLVHGFRGVMIYSLIKPDSFVIGLYSLTGFSILPFITIKLTQAALEKKKVELSSQRITFLIVTILLTVILLPYGVSKCIYYNKRINQVIKTVELDGFVNKYE